MMLKLRRGSLQRRWFCFCLHFSTSTFHYHYTFDLFSQAKVILPVTNPWLSFSCCGVPVLLMMGSNGGHFWPRLIQHHTDVMVMLLCTVKRLHRAYTGFTNLIWVKSRIRERFRNAFEKCMEKSRLYVAILGFPVGWEKVS